MKKTLLTLAVAAVMALSLAGCSSSDSSSASASGSASASAPAPASGDLIGATLPDITADLKGLEMKVIGIENVTYRSNPAVRVWMEVTNNTKYPVEPRGKEGYGYQGYQGDEELDTCIGDNASMEEYYWMRNIIPGLTIRTSMTYQLKDETTPLKLAFETTDGEKSFNFDLKNTSGAPKDAFELKPITTFDWFKPTAETETLFDVEYTVDKVEVIDGYTDTNELGKNVRVTFTAVHNGEKETYLSSPFTPYQDGVSLGSGNAKEKADTDISGAVKIQPNTTETYTYVYRLYNNDPIVFMRMDVTGQRGVVKTLD